MSVETLTELRMEAPVEEPQTEEPVSEPVPEGEPYDGGPVPEVPAEPAEEDGS